MLLVIRNKFLACSPDLVRSTWARLEASPVGYRLAKGAFWSLVGSVTSRGLGLISAVLVARILGKDDYGAFGIVQNTLAVFGTLAGFGMGITANKHVAEFKCSKPDRAGRIIGASSALAWGTSGIMAVLLFLFSPWVANHMLNAPRLISVLQSGAFLLFLSGVNGAQIGTLSGFESFKQIARISLICGILTFPLTLVGALCWGLEGVIWGLVTTQIVNCSLSWRAVRRVAAEHNIAIRIRVEYADFQLFWSFSLPAILTGLLNNFVAWGASAMVVNQVGGYGDMGIYHAALRIKMMPEALLGMLIAPIVPVLSQTFAAGDIKAFRRTVLVSSSLAIFIVVPISLLQVAVPVLTLLPYGADYHGRLAVVQCMMLQALCNALIFPMSSILICMGRMWFDWTVNVLYAVLFASLSWALVPKYGVGGFAAAMALGFLIANVPCVIFLYRMLPDVMHFWSWGWLALTTGLTALICVFAQLFLSVGGATAVAVAMCGVFLLSAVWARTRSVS